MNNTLGPEELFPFALEFREYPQLTTPFEPRTNRSSLQEHAHLTSIARMEMENQMAGLKLKLALNHAILPACDRSYQPGDQVLVYREE